jgi:hypothetical protein
VENFGIKKALTLSCEYYKTNYDSILKLLDNKFTNASAGSFNAKIKPTRNQSRSKK